MGDYIKRDDVIKLVAIILAAEAQIDGYDVDVKDCIPEATAWVKDYCPGVEFKIVRCKECKWASPNKEGDYDCKCHIPIFRVDAEGYCYLADRKESE